MKWIIAFFLIGICSSSVLFPNKATPLTAPLRVIYIDYKSNNPSNILFNNPSNTLFNASAAGYNVLILAFYLSSSGPADMALTWGGVDNATKIDTINKLHAKGVAVLVSFGGGTDNPFSGDPTALGTQVEISIISRYMCTGCSMGGGESFGRC